MVSFEEVNISSLLDTRQALQTDLGLSMASPCTNSGANCTQGTTTRQQRILVGNSVSLFVGLWSNTVTILSGRRGGALMTI